MVRCPKCKCEDYEVIFIEGYDYEGDSVTADVEVECSECGKKFWIKERFKFKSAKNAKGE